MKTLKTVFLSIIVFVTCYSCSDNLVETNNSVPYKRELNISYGINTDQNFDIYLPENRTINTKVIILVHGNE
jgi:hypothetical protein